MDQNIVDNRSSLGLSGVWYIFKLKISKKLLNLKGMADWE